MDRVIGHLDLDYFYAQIEEVEDPSLKTRPVLVCVYSGRTSDSGVVSTANYKAREHNVRSGIPIALAKKRLEGTDAVFIPMRHEKYERYSERVMDLVRGEVDAMEQAGIDEAFFDVTERTGGDYAAAERLALELKSKILREEKLTCSIGLGVNKVVAKMASDYRKPNGFTSVRPKQTLGFLAPLKVGKLYGVGPKTSRALQEDNITTIGELARVPIEKLQGRLGRKLSVYLHDAANGINEEKVVDGGESLQLSRIITLKSDTKEPAKILAELSPALKDVHDRLVARSLFFRTISVMGVLPNLSIRTKSKTLEVRTNDYAIMEREIQGLLEALTSETSALRRVGVRTTDLENMENQTSLGQFAS